MTVRLDIPDSIADSMRLPQPEVESRLRAELALALYAQEILSFGKAAELAGLSRYAFAELIGVRNISRHYSEEDFDTDREYANRGWAFDAETQRR
jgi:predicted HTH domain antitoxin